MNAIDENTIAILEELIEVCRDGEQGFKTAAEDSKADDLRQLFLNYADQRAAFINELQAQVFALGGNTEKSKSGTLSGVVHRGWMNLKVALASDDAAMVLEECERGEDIAKEAYAKALEAELDPETKAIIVRQAISIQTAHDSVKVLRDSTAAAKK